jgi:hypothetical protein
MTAVKTHVAFPIAATLRD